MQYPLCRHIHTAGSQCGSPALHQRDLCFFHQRLHDRHKTFRSKDSTVGPRLYGEHLELAPLEDRAAVQLALSVVINAIGTGQLDTRRANSILYGLQLASMNLPRLRPTGIPNSIPERIVRTATPLPPRLPPRRTRSPLRTNRRRTASFSSRNQTPCPSHSPALPA